MRRNPDNHEKIGRIIIPIAISNAADFDGDNIFRNSAFKPIWDVVRSLKSHDFRLEAGLNRLRGLTALGPINSEEFLEATRIRVLGMDDLDMFHLRIIELTTAKFWWTVQGPLTQYVKTNHHARVSRHHIEKFNDEDVHLGSWVTNLRQSYKNNKLSAQQIDALKSSLVGLGIKFGWWQSIFIGLKIMLENVLSFPGKETDCIIDDEDSNWDGFKQRSMFKQDKLSADLIAALETLPD